MTREDISKLEECRECYGRGTLQTPSKAPAHRVVTCGRCDGTGYVRKIDQPAREES